MISRSLFRVQRSLFDVILSNVSAFTARAANPQPGSPGQFVWQVKASPVAGSA